MTRPQSIRCGSLHPNSGRRCDRVAGHPGAHNHDTGGANFHWDTDTPGSPPNPSPTPAAARDSAAPEIDTAEYRARHAVRNYPDGSRICMHGAGGQWPCDAADLIDALDEARTELADERRAQADGYLGRLRREFTATTAAAHARAERAEAELDALAEKLRAGITDKWTTVATARLERAEKAEAQVAALTAELADARADAENARSGDGLTAAIVREVARADAAVAQVAAVRTAYAAYQAEVADDPHGERGHKVYAQGRLHRALAARAEIARLTADRNLWVERASAWNADNIKLTAQVAAVRALADALLGICNFHAGLTPPRHPREEMVRSMACKMLAALDGAVPPLAPPACDCASMSGEHQFCQGTCEASGFGPTPVDREREQKIREIARREMLNYDQAEARLDAVPEPAAPTEPPAGPFEVEDALDALNVLGREGDHECAPSAAQDDCCAGIWCVECDHWLIEAGTIPPDVPATPTHEFRPANRGWPRCVAPARPGHEGSAYCNMMPNHPVHAPAAGARDCASDFCPDHPRGAHQHLDGGTVFWPPPAAGDS
jgi:hypothetical protein